MRVTFVLPRDHGPGIGGYAVVYGYADRLAERGHRVRVLHVDPPPRSRQRWRWRQWQQRLRADPGTSYGASPRVSRRAVPFLPVTIRAQDAVVATAWSTAGPVSRLARPGNGFYLIQHHEHWAGDAAAVDATWRLPLHRIVVSQWLADVAATLGAAPVTVIPNGLDTEVFRVQIPPADRPAARVAMVWSNHEWKRSPLGWRVLERVAEQRPQLSVEVFGIGDVPSLPSWATWHGKLDQQQVADVFNSVAIMLNPSSSEGWGLPAAEAMACGAAVVTTKDGAARDFAQHGRTAVVVPTDDEDAMVAAVLAMIDEPAARVALAEEAAAFARQHLSWVSAADAFEQLLQRARPR